jgi:hypothetical protein
MCRGTEWGQTPRHDLAMLPIQRDYIRTTDKFYDREIDTKVAFAAGTKIPSY